MLVGLKSVTSSRAPGTVAPSGNGAGEKINGENSGIRHNCWKVVVSSKVTRKGDQRREKNGNEDLEKDNWRRDEMMERVVSLLGLKTRRAINSKE